MKEQLIKFDSIEWENPRRGLLEKNYSDGKTRLKLIRFDEHFVEEEWCHNGHIGYVISGEMSIDFNGTMKQYQKGDGLWIEAGETSKHRLIVARGKQVELILFEWED
jgi:quercetin dioxygenase-like cupin family protein